MRPPFRPPAPNARRGFHLVVRCALQTICLLFLSGSAQAQCDTDVARIIDGGGVPVLGEDHVSFLFTGFGDTRRIYVVDIETGSRTLVADEETPIPEGGGRVFTDFTTHSISGDKLAFIGRGPIDKSGDVGYSGIYLYDIPSATLTKLIDVTDIAPNLPPEDQSENYASLRDLHFNDGKLVFSTAFFFGGTQGREGVYLWDGEGFFALADNRTVIPPEEDIGSATQTFEFFGNVANNGTTAAFVVSTSSADGFRPEGVYLKTLSSIGDDLPRLVRDSRSIGTSGEPPYRFFSVTDFSGSTLAFRASFDEGEDLIGGFYVYDLTTESVAEVTRQSDPIPGGPPGLTWSFGVFIDAAFSVDGLNAAFGGGGFSEDFTVSHQGIYRRSGLVTVPWFHRGDDLNGHPIETIAMSRFGMRDGKLAFRASFSDGTASGIFVTNTDAPSDPNADTDGDGLLDSWEKCGYDANGDGTVDVDLPAMGADPMRKDIFVEVDYMVQPTARRNGRIIRGHSHKPKPIALIAIAKMFADAPVDNPDGSTGISIHIDAGQSSLMNPRTRERWEVLSRSDRLRERTTIGRRSAGGYNWSDFDRYKRRYFEDEREPIFHYCIFGHHLGGYGNTSGVSRDLPASDFLVTLSGGRTQSGSSKKQAGTLVHELGHNLGLHHGGVDDMHYKPNYISSMNYAFQMRGIIKNGRGTTFDYSRWGPDEIPDLDERNLRESDGLDANGELDIYGTRFHCCAPNCRLLSFDMANDPLDWNCNGASNETGLQFDINRSGSIETLKIQNDWAVLVYDGGSIGSTSKGPPPMETEVDELTFDMEEALGPEELEVAVEGPGPAFLAAGTTLDLAFTIENVGTLADTYQVSASSTNGWADLGALKGSHVAPKLTALGPGETLDITIPVTVPVDTQLGTLDEVTLTARSGLDPGLADQVVVEVEVNEDGLPSSDWPDYEDLIRFQQYWLETEHKPEDLIELLRGE